MSSAGAPGSTVDISQLSAALETALLRELRASYLDLNASHFKRALRPAALELSDTVARLGQWDPKTRVIQIARSVVISRPWGIVIEVLKHEMAHQFVHENLGRTDESSHGPAFRETCQRLGIDPRASGLPRTPTTNGTDGTDSGDDRDGNGGDGNGQWSHDGFSHDGFSEGPASEERLLDRVRRLLALAESSNLNEAQAAANAAQRLMLKYNLDLARDATKSDYGFRHLGTPSGRVDESRRILSLILDDHFFVEVIWVPVYRPLEQKRGSVLEICGSHANLELAAYVHDFLSHASEHLWKEHQRSLGIRSNRDRRTYLAGVMEGFREKLESQKNDSQKAGLVWVGDPELDRYYRKRHPHIQRTRSLGNPHTAARHDGRAAGKNLVLHRGVTAGATSRGKLLGPGRPG